MIRLDNDPYVHCSRPVRGAHSKGIALNHIRPEKPAHNAYVERFNKTDRTVVLECYVFESSQEVRDMTAYQLYRYNHHRPHGSLGNLTPSEFVNSRSVQPIEAASL